MGTANQTFLSGTSLRPFDGGETRSHRGRGQERLDDILHQSIAYRSGTAFHEEIGVLMRVLIEIEELDRLLGILGEERTWGCWRLSLPAGPGGRAGSRKGCAKKWACMLGLVFHDADRGALLAELEPLQGRLMEGSLSDEDVAALDAALARRS